MLCDAYANIKIKIFDLSTVLEQVRRVHPSSKCNEISGKYICLFIIQNLFDYYQIFIK